MSWAVYRTWRESERGDYCSLAGHVQLQPVPEDLQVQASLLHVHLLPPPEHSGGAAKLPDSPVGARTDVMTKGSAEVSLVTCRVFCR